MAPSQKTERQLAHSLTGSSILPRLFSFAAVALSISAVAAYLYIALARLSYPFALEWIEPNSYGHVARILQGRPLYAPPSYDFIPMIYAPLYFYVAAAVAWITNDITLAMRLVSCVSSLAVFGLLYGIARIRRLSWIASLLAIGLFALTYGVTSYWFDISRVDTLFVALLLLAYLLALTGPGSAWGYGAAAGVVLCLACMAKQQAALAFPFLLAYVLTQRPRRKALGFGASFLACFGTYLLVANYSSGGWFWFYTLAVPGAAPIQPQLQRDFWAIHLLPHFYPALLGIGFGLLALTLRREWAGLRAWLAFSGALGVPLFAMSYLSMTKQWGFVNGLMPLAAALALLVAEALSAALDSASQQEDGQQSYDRLAALAARLASIVALLQFPVLRYDVAAAIPSRADQRAGEYLVQLVKQAPGPVFAATMPQLLAIAGQPLHFHPSSLGDLNLAAQSSPAVQAVLDRYGPALNAPLLAGTIDLAVLPDVNWYDHIFNKKNGYHCEPLLASQQLTTVSGARNSLARLCRKR